MAACSIFDEDEVCIPTSSGGFKYGLVVESSEYISSDEEDSDDENRVQRGQVKVAWHPSGDETVVSEKKVILTDRSLMPGDVVRRLISGEESQRGFVQSCNIKCHVKILGTEQYIYNIDAKDIKPIQEFDPEPEVTLDSWVGHVMEVVEDITVRFPCGARCKLSNAGVLNLEDVQDKRPHHSEFVMRNFYPGQELSGIYEDYEDATWIHTSNVRGPKCKVKSLFTATVVVEEVKTQNVEVNWVCKGFTRTGAGTDKLKSPPNMVEGEDLKRLRRLDCFEYCHMQIGDKGYYTVKESDTVLHKISPRKHVTPDIIQLKASENILVIGTSADGIHVKRRGSSKKVGDKELNDKNNTDDANKENCDINKEDSKKESEKEDKEPVDDEFEDMEDNGSDSGSETDSVKSGPESPAPKRKNRKRSGLLGHGFKRVRGKKAKKKAHRIEREVKPGDRVPIEIWYTFSACNVMWQDGSVEENVPSPELFPIHHLDELEFFPGDFILDNKGNASTDYGVIISSDHKERTVMVKWVKPYISGKSTGNKPEEKEPVELSVFDVKDHPDYKFRCGHTVIRVGGYEGDTDHEAVGQVYRIDPEGTIQVWWPNRVITKCYPQDLYIIGEEFQSESGSESEWTDEGEEEEEEEEEGSDVSWETENEDTATDTDTEGKKNKSKQLWAVSDSKKKELDALLDRAQTAVSGLLNIFVNVAGPFFKNSRQVFHDILAIFKRCKEVEKILKSSFFEDDEIADLISDIKYELRKEKTAKLARHIAQVYKFRNATEDDDNQSGKDLDNTENESEVVTESSKTEDEPSQENGAVGGKPVAKGDVDTLRRLCKALTDYGANIDDPIMQIIFDTSLHATIAESAQKSLKSAETEEAKENSSDSSCGVGAKGDSANENVEDLVNNLSASDIIQTVIDSVCDNSDQELHSAFQAVKQKVQLACNMKGKVEETSQVKEQTGAEESAEKGAQSAVIAGSQADTQSTDKTGSQDADDKSEETVLPPSHRTLCIHVCKALNVRLLHVKQEVNRKWLVYKFGCNEDVSDLELFEKMKSKVIESVESGVGPLQLDTVASSDSQQSATNRTECIKELESLEEMRTSLENGLCDTGSLVEKQEAEENLTNGVLEVTNGIIEEKGFEVCSETPFSHRFKYQEQKPSNQKSFSTAVRKEWMLLRTSLPDGIFVKVFEDRMDLLSVMIKGPVNTPYEDGLFFFDVHLPANFPNSPPVFHYHSYCNERLNPNLYEDGKVCVSLLGTWTGKGNELWTTKSSVLQVLVSIQGLILVPEPYFNEAGYEKQRGSQHGQENSRMYNEMAVLKLVQSMTKMAVAPSEIFMEETKAHLRNHAYRMIERVEKWVEYSNKSRLGASSVSKNFPTICNGHQEDLELSASQVSEPVKTGEVTDKETAKAGKVTDQETAKAGEVTHQETVKTGEVSDQETAEAWEVTHQEPSKMEEAAYQESAKTGEVTPERAKTGEVNHQETNKPGEATHLEPDKVEISSDNGPGKTGTSTCTSLAEMPLLPASKGFCLAVKKSLECFKEVLSEHVFNLAA